FDLPLKLVIIITAQLDQYCGKILSQYILRINYFLLFVRIEMLGMIDRIGFKQIKISLIFGRRMLFNDDGRKGIHRHSLNGKTQAEGIYIVLIKGSHQKTLEIHCVHVNYRRMPVQLQRRMSRVNSKSSQ